MNDPTVDRAARRASAFAAAARGSAFNTSVVESVEEDRLYASAPLTRHYRVDVTDTIGRVTMAIWSVELEPVRNGRRSVRFFGWAFGPGTPGRKIDFGLACVRVTN